MLPSGFFSDGGIWQNCRQIFQNSFGLRCRTVACIEARRMIPYCPYLTYQHLQQCWSDVTYFWLRRREILCEANISRPLQPPTKLLNKKHAGVRRAAPLQLPPLHAAKSETIPDPSRSKYALNCFDALKRPHPEKPGLSVPPLNPERETIVGPPVIKHVYREGCQTTFVFCLFIFHIYNNNKLTSGSLQTLIQA